MSRFAVAAIVPTVLCCSSCDKSDSDPARVPGTQETAAEIAEPAHFDLYLAAASRAHAFAGGDLERTSAYYRDNPAHWLYEIDLNGDGVDEAIVNTNLFIDEAGKLGNADGVTGNRPRCVFHLRDGSWHPLVQEDFWCRDYTVHEETVNGWAVLSSMSRLSIAEYPVEVYAYEDGRYRIIYEHTWIPREDPPDSR
jgi:hypothetical protein